MVKVRFGAAIVAAGLMAGGAGLAMAPGFAQQNAPQPPAKSPWADFVERDLMLLKVAAPAGAKRTEVRELVDIFRGKIVDVGEGEMMIEISGRESKVESFIQRMRPYGILELVRTGRVALVRGAQGAARETEPTPAPTSVL